MLEKVLEGTMIALNKEYQSAFLLRMFLSILTKSQIFFSLQDQNHMQLHAAILFQALYHGFILVQI